MAAMAVLALLPAPGMAQDGAKDGAKDSLQQKTAAPDKPAEPPKAATAPAPQQVSAPAGPAAVSAKPEPEPPFAAMAGSWSGGGTLSLSGGSRERLRCRAHHTVGHGGNSLSMSIRCASASTNFGLSSHVVQKRDRIHGSWSESSTGAAGSVSGSASGGHIRAVAHGSGFSAGIAITTDGGRQSVSITPRGTFITGVHVALRKR
jgi:hypothetical protein